MKVFTGPRGGKYVIKEGKKVYLKKTDSLVSKSKDAYESNKDTSSGKDIVQTLKKVRHCCCCGRELNDSDCNYYDLTDYCPRCALADGIITSLE